MLKTMSQMITVVVEAEADKLELPKSQRIRVEMVKMMKTANSKVPLHLQLSLKNQMLNGPTCVVLKQQKKVSKKL